MATDLKLTKEIMEYVNQTGVILELYFYFVAFLNFNIWFKKGCQTIGSYPFWWLIHLSDPGKFKC